MNKLTTILATLALVLVTLTGASAQPSEAVSQPASQAPTFDTFYLGSAAQWGAETLAAYGITPASDTLIVYTNTDNCGAKLSEAGLGGCTTTLEDGSHLVTVSPELKYSAWGVHILIHEYAHTLGYGECAAEAYAHSYEGNSNLWSYPECEEL